MLDFHALEPHAILRAAEEAGFEPTGELVQLNSYENRVFDLALESGERIIAKFYRPGRWSEQTILEEHRFLLELRENDITAVAPLTQAGGRTLTNQSGLWTAFFPKVRGRLPDELLDQDLVAVGRLLARVHNVGTQRPAPARLSLDVGSMDLWGSLDLLQDRLAPELRDRYNDAAEELLENLEDTIEPRSFLRIHGDCHRGNLLNDGKSFFLVDFDDFVNGPAVQDFWMLLSGDADRTDEELELLLSGYEELREFPREQLEWIPLLRGLRIINYSAWIERRWTDPSFPRLFPDYGSYSYWARETEALELILRG
jgi:Ser/Thr protein kinase RdoA (MazF antagonist)